jgi:orotate phosphoribosyltransferase
MEAKLLDLLSARRGHFRLESGHHGNLWLDLDSLFLEPKRLLPFAGELARRLSAHRVEVVVGPLVGGALLAQMVAAELGVLFCFSEKADRKGDGLYATPYRIPDAFHPRLRGRDVAIVDDAINAGSATRATFAALKSVGARPVVVGALIVLGNAASAFLETNSLPAERIAFLPNEIWTPAECPMCARALPINNPAGEP